jgi:hypothetical protein
MFSSSNPHSTIRFHGRIFTPKLKQMTMPFMAHYPKIFTFSLAAAMASRDQISASSPHKSKDD